MAWELTYTSVASGPTGRSGFQFVTAGPDAPPDVVRAATPYMTYRPPPDAPSAPTPEEMARFPVALAYGRAGEHAVLARCHYTGRDYSGRYGNFVGHAVVAAPAELEGLRPIEFWGSPVWDRPAGEAVTGDALVPGAVFDPETLAAWLRREGAHDRLAALVDAVAGALAGGHGRVVLVAREAELIARWIAAISYSLPSELATELSFITYTADPEAAPQLVVGTVPAAWPGGFRLDEPFPGARPGRFARVLAGCWQAGDLAGIDAVGDLITGDGSPARPSGLVPSGNDAGSPGASPADIGSPGASAADTEPPGIAPAGTAASPGIAPGDAAGPPGIARADAAAALLALCRGDASVSAAEQAAAAALVRSRGAPAWAWPAVAGALPRLGFELAAALSGLAPQIAEHCVVLALGDPALRDALPRLRLRDGLPDRFRAALAGASGLPALAGILCLAERVGGTVTAGDVRAAAAACARRGAGDVAAAVAATPERLREAMVSGVVAGLEASEPPVRRALLTPEACAALGGRDWTRAPRTGALVLATGPDRLAATAGLIELAPYGLPDAEALLGGLWAAPPAVAECRWLVERLGPALLRYAPLRGLTGRVFDSAPLEAEDTLRLARLIAERLPEAAAPARTVLAGADAARAGSDDEVATALARMEPDGALAERATAGAARVLGGRPPAARARVLVAAGAVRDGVARHWIAAGPGRRQRPALAETEVLLAAAGVACEPLRDWADDLGRLARRQVESALADRDPRLAEAWRRLRRRGT